MHRLAARTVYKITFFASLAGAVAAVSFVAYNAVAAWSGASTNADAGSRSGSDAAATNPDDAKLFVEESDLDMGTQYEADHYEHTFDVKNITDQAIKVTYWQRSCSCADVSPAGPLVFEPGETKKLTASFKLIPKKWSDDPSEGVLFGVRIYPTVRENDEDVKLGAWEFHCRILPTFHLNPPVLSLGDHSEKGGTLEGSVDVMALLPVRSVECEGNARWEVEVQTPDESRKAYRLRIRSKGKFGLEEIREKFTVTVRRENGELLPVKELAVVGKVVQDVVADPPQILFGRQTCGARGTETVSFRSLTGGAFHVRPVASDGEGVKVVAVGSGEGKYTLTVAFEHEGKQSAVARFVVEESDGTEYEVAVPVRYYGIRAKE